MIKAENSSDNFEFTMSGLEKGLLVVHITTPAAQLLSCQHDEDIETVLTRSDLESFDHIPVKAQKTIVGLLERRTGSEKFKGLVRNYMKPLGEESLVSADMPLLKFIQNTSLNRIVISDTKIYGLVTESDLFKLPVTLLGFALVTHIEQLLLNMIRDISKTDWMTWLPQHDRNGIQKKFDKLAKKRSDPDILELTTFWQKIVILEKLGDSKEYSTCLPDREFIEQLHAIKALRNTVAHTGDTPDDDATLQEFIVRLRMAYSWIEHMRK